MVTIDIEKQLSGHIFAYLLILTRMGAAFMFFPGIGEAFVNARIRLILAMTISFLVLPVLGPTLPAIPSQPAILTLLLIQEVTIGIFFGCVLRVLMNAVETAGTVISLQIGISNATILNPTLASQSALPSAFLGMMALVLIFITGLDRLLIQAIIDTYNIFPPGEFPSPGDMVETYSHMVTQSFTKGVELAGPFIIGGLLIYTALGLMQRLMQQVQLFLIIMPVQILGGFALFAATLAAMMGAWIRYFDNSLNLFLSP